jgi:hypothetical protein
LVQMIFVVAGIVFGKQDGAAGERGHLLNLRLAEKRGLILGVLRRIGLAGFRFRSGTELGVGAVGSEACGG